MSAYFQMKTLHSEKIYIIPERNGQFTNWRNRTFFFFVYIMVNLNFGSCHFRNKKIGTIYIPQGAGILLLSHIFIQRRKDEHHFVKSKLQQCKFKTIVNTTFCFCYWGYWFRLLKNIKKSNRIFHRGVKFLIGYFHLKTYVPKKIM